MILVVAVTRTHQLQTTNENRSRKKGQNQSKTLSARDTTSLEKRRGLCFSFNLLWFHPVFIPSISSLVPTTLSSNRPFQPSLQPPLVRHHHHLLLCYSQNLNANQICFVSKSPSNTNNLIRVLVRYVKIQLTKSRFRSGKRQIL